MKEEILKELKKEQKKNFKKTIVLVITTAILFGTVGVAAGSYTAKQISFRPSDSTWKVSNVSDAIDDLKFKKVSNNYSTEETVVGTWIDGKPLYQKTVKVTNTANSWGSTPHNISDINLEEVQITGVSHFNNNVVDGSGWRSSYVAGIPEINSTNVSYFGASAGTAIITFQYTKTTDEATN